MYVNFIHDEEERVFRFWKPPVQRLYVEVTFDDEELYYIDRYRLTDYAVLERKPTIEEIEDEDDDGTVHIVKEKIDNNVYLKHFYDRAPMWTFPNPASRRAFQFHLMEAFERTQQYLTQNGCSPVEVEFDGVER